jgi:hypothetical protein
MSEVPVLLGGFVGQVGNLRPIVNRPSARPGATPGHRFWLAAMWGRQSCLQPPFEAALTDHAQILALHQAPARRLDK